MLVIRNAGAILILGILACGGSKVSEGTPPPASEDAAALPEASSSDASFCAVSQADGGTCTMPADNGKTACTAPDGCNRCTCVAPGGVPQTICTLLPCPSPPPPPTDAGACVAFDAAQSGDCTRSGCPTGFACAVEIGGVAGGGGSWCAPIPPACTAAPTCACMASCACASGVGGRPESCTDRNGVLECDNGVR